MTRSLWLASLLMLSVLMPLTASAQVNRYRPTPCLLARMTWQVSQPL